MLDREVRLGGDYFLRIVVGVASVRREEWR